MSDQPILLYDNECGVCHWLVRFVLKNDQAGRFVFASLASRPGRELLARHGVPPSVDSVVLIDKSRAYTRGDAVVRLIGQLNMPWRLLAISGAFPRRWRDWGYDTIARRRARISQRLGLACTLPTLEEQQRFLGDDRKPDSQDSPA